MTSRSGHFYRPTQVPTGCQYRRSLRPVPTGTAEARLSPEGFWIGRGMGPLWFTSAYTLDGNVRNRPFWGRTHQRRVGVFRVVLLNRGDSAFRHYVLEIPGNKVRHAPGQGLMYRSILAHTSLGGTKACHPPVGDIRSRCTLVFSSRDAPHYENIADEIWIRGSVVCRPSVDLPFNVERAHYN